MLVCGPPRIEIPFKTDCSRRTGHGGLRLTSAVLKLVLLALLLPAAQGERSEFRAPAPCRAGACQWSAREDSPFRPSPGNRPGQGRRQHGVTTRIRGRHLHRVDIRLARDASSLRPGADGMSWDQRRLETPRSSSGRSNPRSVNSTRGPPLDSSTPVSSPPIFLHSSTQEPPKYFGPLLVFCNRDRARLEHAVVQVTTRVRCALAVGKGSRMASRRVASWGRSLDARCFSPLGRGRDRNESSARVPR